MSAARTRRIVSALTASAVTLPLAVILTAPARANTPTGDQVATIAKGQVGNTACSNGGYEGSCYGEEWCADFSKWAWNQAGYADTGDITAAAYTFARHGASHPGTFHWVTDTSYTPQPGDAVIWRGNGYPLSSTTNPALLDFDDVQHVDLVELVKSRTQIVTIGGNEESKVSETPDQSKYPGSYINPTVEQIWGQQVIGYISPGAATPPTPTTLNSFTVNGSGAADQGTVSGTIQLSAAETKASKVWYYLDDTTPASGSSPGLIASMDSGGGASPAHWLNYNTATGAVQTAAGTTTAQALVGTHTITAAAFDQTNSNTVVAFKTITVTAGNNNNPLSITGMGDGTAQAAVIGGDGILYHEIRDVNGNWSGMQPVQNDSGGAMRAKTVAISGTPDGSAQLLVQGGDGLLYWGARMPNGTWTGFTALKGITNPTMQVQAISITGMGDGSSQIAVIGGDGILYHEIRSVNGTWSGLRPVQNDNGTAMQAKTVAISGTPDGSAQLLVEGGDGLLYWGARMPNGTWTGFTALKSINGPTTQVKAVSIAGMHDGSSQIAVIGGDGILYHEIRDVNGTWSGLQALIGDNELAMHAKSVSITGTPDGSAQVLAEGGDGILYHEARYSNGTWTNFSWLPSINGQPMHVGS
ncbi:MAG: CHAP domain-containing protein [Streptomyces sp.]|nr:CHAP domain-containing protein [Streptomyces sp.]